MCSSDLIACGGGVVLDPAHRALLRERCEVVWLEVSAAEAARRVAGGAVRPLLAGAEPEARLAALLAERAPLYAAVADRRLDTGALSAEAVADAILAPDPGRAGA